MRFVWLKMESRLQDQLKQHLTDHASTTSRYVVSVFLSLLSAVGTVGNATVLWVFWVYCGCSGLVAVMFSILFSGLLVFWTQTVVDVAVDVLSVLCVFWVYCGCYGCTVGVLAVLWVF